MSQIKAKAAALAERRSREDDVVVEVAAVKAVEKPSETEAAAGWSVPSEASERFALYQRLCGQTDLPPQAQRWLGGIRKVMSIRRCPNGRCWLDFRRPFGV